MRFLTNFFLPSLFTQYYDQITHFSKVFETKLLGVEKILNVFATDITLLVMAAIFVYEYCMLIRIRSGWKHVVLGVERMI